MEKDQRDGSVSATAAPARWSRWQPLSGIAFVVLFVVGWLMTNTPDNTASNKVWTDYFADRGHRVVTTVSAFVLLAAALCLLAFLTTLWTRIASARGPGATSPFGLVAAGVAAACIALGAVMQAGVTGAMLFGSAPEPGADTLRLVLNLSFPFIAVAGMFAASVSIATLSIQASATGVLGRRLLALSLVVAVGLLGSVAFFPMALLPIWVVVMTVVLIRRETASPAPIAPPATAQLSGMATRAPSVEGSPTAR